MEYGVRAIPAGAFVRIVGMSSADEVDPADESRTYREQPYRWRLLVITAGSIMHMIIAFVLLFVSSPRQVTSRRRVRWSSPPHRPPGRRRISPVCERTTSCSRSTTRRHDPEGVRLGDPGRRAGQRGRPHDRSRRDDTAGPRRPGAEPELLRTDGFLGVSSDSQDWVDKTVVEAAGLAVTEMGRGVVNIGEGRVHRPQPGEHLNHLTGATDDPETRPTTMVGPRRSVGFLVRRRA